MLSKKQMSAQWLQKNEQLFRCPYCEHKFSIQDEKTLVCPNGHSFDLAKQGYVNLLTHPVQSMYDQKLFEARKQVLDAMLYADVYDVILEQMKDLPEVMTVLDTGCGEGTHLFKLKEQCKQEMIATGIDLSKEGILTAAKNYTDLLWVVGDLAKSPYRSAQFDVILNILSPANYEEFKRLLKPNGKVIKVVPQSGYLQELRKQFYATSEKEAYSNNQTVERFKESFPHVDIFHITTTKKISTELVPLLAHMTPMGWHQEKKIENLQLDEITIDVDVLIGSL